MSQPQKYYHRFSLSQRIEHWVQVFAFTLLAITGIPQKFAGTVWAENVIWALGGIEAIRIVHRYAAVVLLLGVIYHGGYVTYKVFVERVRLTMLPGWKDATDMFGVFAYNLGLRSERPKLPHYNFEEKLEYWAFVWGTVIMVITGFILWNPIATTSLFPGSFIPAAKAAHGGEALLAVLAIIVWHMYGVHIRKFNKSMFTGKLPRQEMEHEHALELEKIENDELPPPPPPEEVARRRKIFIPVGTVITVVLLVGLFWFVTFEQTAISTVVAATEEGEAFQPLPITLGENIHGTLEEYTGPETCADSDCHSGAVLETAQMSEHGKRIVGAGPDPWLARLTEATAPENTTPNCLVCHAKEYQPDDLLASAQTVGPSGGESCRRCHSTGHPMDTLHNDVGLACIGCHTASSHEVQREVSCNDCHRSLPHQNALLNTKHQRMDCRTCHVTLEAETIVLDATQPQRDPVTGYFGPTIEPIGEEHRFAWQTPDGASASIDDETAIIVPLVPITVLAPEDLDPVEFAKTGQTAETGQETTFDYVPNHGVTRAGVRTCNTCHGPDADFDFAALGYDEETVEKLSLTTE